MVGRKIKIVDHVVNGILQVDVTELHLAAGIDLSRNAGLIGNNYQEVARFLHAVKSLWNAGNYPELCSQVCVFGVVYIENAVTIEKHAFIHCCKYRSRETGDRSQEEVSIKCELFVQDSDSCLLNSDSLLLDLSAA